MHDEICDCNTDLHSDPEVDQVFSHAQGRRCQGKTKECKQTVTIFPTTTRDSAHYSDPSLHFPSRYSHYTYQKVQYCMTFEKYTYEKDGQEMWPQCMRLLSSWTANHNVQEFIRKLISSVLNKYWQHFLWPYSCLYYIIVNKYKVFLSRDQRAENKE